MIDSLTFGLQESHEKKGGVNFASNIMPVFQALKSLAQDTGATIVVLTHSENVKPKYGVKPMVRT